MLSLELFSPTRSSAESGSFGLRLRTIMEWTGWIFMSHCSGYGGPSGRGPYARPASYVPSLSCLFGIKCMTRKFLTSTKVGRGMCVPPLRSYVRCEQDTVACSEVETREPLGAFHRRVEGWLPDLVRTLSHIWKRADSSYR